MGIEGIILMSLEEKKESKEIEITPKMIAAGLKAFYIFDSRFDDDETAVINIFRAMVSQSVRRP